MTNKLIHMIFAATLMSVATAVDNGRNVNGCCACPGTSECYQVTSSCDWGSQACCNGGRTSGGVYLCNSNSATSSALPTVEAETPTTATPTVEAETTTTATTTTIAECAFCKEYAFMRDGDDPQHKQDNDGKCWSTNEPGSSNGLHLCNACADTPGWADFSSYECSDYEKNDWCANGTVLHFCSRSRSCSCSLYSAASGLSHPWILSVFFLTRLLRTLNSRSLFRSFILFLSPYHTSPSLHLSRRDGEPELRR